MHFQQIRYKLVLTVFDWWGRRILYYKFFFCLVTINNFSLLTAGGFWKQKAYTTYTTLYQISEHVSMVWCWYEIWGWCKARWSQLSPPCNHPKIHDHYSKIDVIHLFLQILFSFPLPCSVFVKINDNIKTK